MLSDSVFKTVIENTPLFAIDLVIINEKNELLVGKRLNSPAKGAWFVPGGRVFKNEPLAAAFQRISQNEVGVAIDMSGARLLGLYDHFYNDSVYGPSITTHYINATHSIKLEQAQLNLPIDEQHETYRWVALSEVRADDSIHKFSKCFMDQLA